MIAAKVVLSTWAALIASAIDHSSLGLEAFLHPVLGTRPLWGHFSTCAGDPVK